MWKDTNRETNPVKAGDEIKISNGYEVFSVDVTDFDINYGSVYAGLQGERADLYYPSFGWQPQIWIEDAN